MGKKIVEKEMYKNKIIYLFLLIYFIATSAYQLGTGFDAILIRLSTVFLLLVVFVIRKKIILSKSFMWIYIFWGYYCLSMLWAHNVNDTLAYVNTFIQILVVFTVMPLIINSKEDINKVLKCLLISFIYAAILVCVRANINFLNLSTVRLGNEIGLHPNLFGLRMAIASIIVYYFMRKDITFNTRRQNIIYLICFVFLVIMTLLSGSRKAFGLCLGATLLFECLNSKKSKMILKLFLCFIIGIFVVMLCLKNETLYKIIGKRLDKTIQIYTGQLEMNNNTDKSITERTFYIDQAINLFFKYPIFGYGGNNFMSYMREINYSHIAYSHNNYVELLSTLGIVGTVLYYSYWFGIEILLLKRYLKKKSDAKTILFLIIISFILILDYWNVSYVNEINFVFVSMIPLYFKYYDAEEIKLKWSNNE